jgi:hypothetical protein
MIEEAREVAADLLGRSGRRQDASIVAAGSGDDFSEVRTALAALERRANRLDLIERALRCYADPSFWDEEMPEASLAFHDKGDIARSELAGRDMFAQHRD